MPIDPVEQSRSQCGRSQPAEWGKVCLTAMEEEEGRLRLNESAIGGEGRYRVSLHRLA